jgi:hypothetical protein
VQVQFMAVVAVEGVELRLLLRQQLITAAVHFMAAVVVAVVTQLLLRVTVEVRFGAAQVRQVQQPQPHLLMARFPPVALVVQKQQTQAQVVVVEFASLIGKRTL